ncbi:WD repeat-containing protein 5 [Escovopsis weberi]|uniref:Mitochondrial division protein 1 n=1 Tax=Escovopsis weberi TaxID=150374 RepID=A0A0M9VU05_ESCWE|nr:WD repeat-containing protein 5 [Escovopsis weberi]
MSSPDELARDTPPPFKRRKTRESLPPRSSSPDALAGDPEEQQQQQTQTQTHHHHHHDNQRHHPEPERRGFRVAVRVARAAAAQIAIEIEIQVDIEVQQVLPHTIADRIPTVAPPPSPPTPPPPAREPLRPAYRARLVLHGHAKAVSQVRISPDGRFIASASADATVKVWDAATGVHMDTLVGHMAGVSCLAWTPDSNTLASGSDDKAIRLWDRVTGRPKTTARKAAGAHESALLRGHHNYIHCLAFSPKGNILASGSYDEAIFLWDVRAGRLMRSLPAHSDPVSGIDFCRDGTLVVSCSTDGLIRVWDTSTGQCLRTLVHEDNPAVTNVCFSPNGRFVLAFNLDNCIRLWDYVSGSVKKTYQGHRNSRFAIGGCFGTLDGEAFIASASEQGDVVLWNVKTKELVQHVAGAHEGVCFWVDVHGDTMVSAGQDSRIVVYRHQREAGGANGCGDGNGNGNGNGTTGGDVAMEIDAGRVNDVDDVDVVGGNGQDAGGEEEKEEEEQSVLQGELPIRQEDAKSEDIKLEDA